jgi:hypothetical protein
VHWANGGLSSTDNLVLLCPFHHRALHAGAFSIEGNPQDGTLRFLDPWDNPIAPPEPNPPGGGRPPDPGGRGPLPYTAPLAERLTAGTFTWN